MATTELASELESDLQDTVHWGRKWLVDFIAGKAQLVSFDPSNKNGSIDVKLGGSVLEETSSFEVSLYLYKSTICPCMECCCHVWAGVPSCYLELLDKLQKQICRTVGPSLAAVLEPFFLAHRQNVAS